MKIDSKLNDVLKAFAQLGFIVTSQKEHIKMKNETGETISIPNHKRVKGSTLSRICREKGIDKNRLFRLI